MTAPITINIIGACVSRNIFNSKIGLPYDVKKYSFNCHPLLMFQQRLSSLTIDDDQIEKLPNPEFTHKFPRTMMKKVIQGGLDKDLLNDKGEWIVVDTHYSIYNATKVTAGEISFIEQSNYAEYIKQFVKNNNYKVTVEKFNKSIDVENYLPDFIEYMKNWEGKIILLISKPSRHYISNKKIYEVNSDVYYQDLISNYTFGKIISENIDCHILDIPFDPISADKRSYVHYTQTTFNYLKQRIDLIVTNKDTSENITRLNLKYEMLANAELLKISGQYSCAASLIEKCIDKSPLLANEYFELCWKINNSDQDKKMIGAILPLAQSGDGGAMGRLAKAYRYGRGVDKNIDLSKEWSYKAINAGIEWARNDLFDLLWQMNTPVSDAEMVEVIRIGVEKENVGSIIRLSKAYRDGRGVAKDYSCAASILRKAIDLGANNIITEYCDLLWKVNDYQSIQKLIDVAKKDIDNPVSMSYLTKIYSEGIYTVLDYEKALFYFSIAQSATTLYENKIIKDLGGLFEKYDNMMKKDVYRTNNEHLRFFYKMQSAKGALRLLQITSILLIKEFDKICHDNNITYWALGGTLLGSVRHGGFIPWDDDIDVGMLRDDYIKLKTVCNQHTNCCIEDVYYFYGLPHHVCNISFKGYTDIFRIDIFLHDYCKDCSDERWHVLKNEYDRLYDMCTIYRKNNKIKYGARITDKHTIEEIESMIRLCHYDDSSYRGGIIWSLDNVNCAPMKRIYAPNIIFPPKYVKFEGIDIMVPCDSEHVVSNDFKNYMTLPTDMFRHNHNTLSLTNVDRLKELLTSYNSNNEVR